MNPIRIKSDDELLDIDTRKCIIDQINGNENMLRKKEAFRRYEAYKDLTNKYVIQRLLDQYEPSTVKELNYAISNISIAKKVIDKLARVYSSGLKREVMIKGAVDGQPKQDDESTKQIEAIGKYLSIDNQMKKSNRFVRLQRNILAYIKPCQVTQPDGTPKYKIKIDPLQPYLYDVIEDYYDRELPLACVLSNYKNHDTPTLYTQGDAAFANRGAQRVQTPQENTGDGVDETIADTPADADANKDEYIFWSRKYHFTCNAGGEIISGPDILNPIEELTFVSIATDQDGQYWALGGSDLVDMSININCMITHMNDLGVRQGHGQFWMSGKSLPTNVVVGPNRVLRLEHEENDPKPEVGFAQSNPQLAELRKNIEMQVALLLTTNNLSTSGLKTALDSANNIPSGISQMIDKSESVEDVEDQRQMFHDIERSMWRIVAKWLDYLGSKGMLVDEMKDFKLNPDMEIILKFNPAQPILSESEKLDNIKKRKDLGLNTMAELMQIDNPDLTNDQAEEKLQEINDERAARMDAMGLPQNPDQPPQPGDMNGNQANSDKGNGKPPENQLNN